MSAVSFPPGAPMSVSTNAEILKRYIDNSVSSVFLAIVKYCVDNQEKTPKQLVESRLSGFNALSAVDAKAQKIFDKISAGLKSVLETPQPNASIKAGCVFINAFLVKIKTECVPERIRKEANDKAIDAEAGTRAAANFLKSFVEPETNALIAKLKTDGTDIYETL